MYYITSALKNEGITELYEGLIRKINGWNTNVELIKEKKKMKLKLKKYKKIKKFFQIGIAVTNKSKSKEKKTEYLRDFDNEPLFFN